MTLKYCIAFFLVTVAVEAALNVINIVRAEIRIARVRRAIIARPVTSSEDVSSLFSFYRLVVYIILGVYLYFMFFRKSKGEENGQSRNNPDSD